MCLEEMGHPNIAVRVNSISKSLKFLDPACIN